MGLASGEINEDGRWLFNTGRWPVGMPAVAQADQ